MTEITRAFDVDDLLFDFINPFLEWHKNTHNTSVCKKQIFTYELEKIFEVSFDEMINRVGNFYSTPAFQELPPYEHAKELMDSLNNADVNIAVTARHSSIKKITMQSLERHFPKKIKEVYFTNQYKFISPADKMKRKVDICVEMGAKIIAEDSYRNCLDCAEVGIKAFLLIQPWNRKYLEQKTHPMIYPVNSLREMAIHPEFISV